MTVKKADHDPVNFPRHYTGGVIECIDAIKASMSPVEFQGFLKGQVIKYQWRYRYKGGSEDLEKAQWYLIRQIEQVAKMEKEGRAE